MDITQLILDDHQEQRRLFAILEQVPDDNPAALQAIWQRLSAFLEVHAEAEERFFYPALLQVGQGEGAKSNARDETKDAIKDHNEIRDAVSAVACHPVGTPRWHAAIAKANIANSDHMGEEEREGLTDFRRRAPMQMRYDLAVSFAAFEAVHVTGVAVVDKDPQQFVDEHSRR
ncbi:MAG TPA: hemerythrin domain-containing protein [Caldimonas sp.]|nr:hemerythrin domain-containing protein [Caldimonas sp.]